MTDEVQFEAACSGLRYENHQACGEVAAIWVCGTRWPIQSEVSVRRLAIDEAAKCALKVMAKGDCADALLADVAVALHDLANGA